MLTRALNRVQHDPANDGDARGEQKIEDEVGGEHRDCARPKSFAERGLIEAPIGCSPRRDAAFHLMVVGLKAHEA